MSCVVLGMETKSCSVPPLCDSASERKSFVGGALPAALLEAGGGGVSISSPYIGGASEGRPSADEGVALVAESRVCVRAFEGLTLEEASVPWEGVPRFREGGAGGGRATGWEVA